LRPNIRSTVGQDDKHSLKRILSILLVAKYAITYPKHERSMPIDEFPEGSLVTSEKRREESAIGFAGQIPDKTGETGQGRIHRTSTATASLYS
jgi:hypothetical protein